MGEPGETRDFRLEGSHRAVASLPLHKSRGSNKGFDLPLQRHGELQITAADERLRVAHGADDAFTTRLRPGQAS
jgi:hypothetical protein